MIEYRYFRVSTYYWVCNQGYELKRSAETTVQRSLHGGYRRAGKRAAPQRDVPFWHGLCVVNVHCHTTTFITSGGWNCRAEFSTLQISPLNHVEFPEQNLEPTHTHAGGVG